MVVGPLEPKSLKSMRRSWKGTVTANLGETDEQVVFIILDQQFLETYEIRGLIEKMLVRRRKKMRFLSNKHWDFTNWNAGLVDLLMKMKVQPLINGKIPGPGGRRLRLPGVHGWASAAAPSRTLGWLLAMRMMMVPTCSNRLFLYWLVVWSIFYLSIYRE